MKSNKTITKPTSKPVKNSGKIRTGGVVVTTPTKKPVTTSISDLRERLAIPKKVAPAKPVTKPVSVDKIKSRFDNVDLGSKLRPDTVTTSVPAAKAAPAMDSTEAPEKAKPVFTDLHPWPFEKKFKGVIRRREWNGLVANIQKDACAEMHAENESLHATVAELLNERDSILARFNEMREFMRKQHHDFDTKFN